MSAVKFKFSGDSSELLKELEIIKEKIRETSGQAANMRVAKVDKLFVISRNLKTYFSSIGVPSDKIEIINMTVDQSRFEGLQRNPKERYIAYCGKATNNKDGVNILIKSFSHISQVHPDVKLYIIGTPPNENDESGNMQLVGDLNLVDKVVFTGMVSHQDMPQMLKNAEVLVLARPSSKQADYGFPTKLGEYLLTENPVVITDVGNISDFLHDGKSIHTQMFYRIFSKIISHNYIVFRLFFNPYF